MISAYARAYQVLHDESYLEVAEHAVRFLCSKLVDPLTGKLFRRYRDTEAKHDAQLADYAFFIQGLLDLYEASFQIGWLQKAIALMEDQIVLFYDHDRGGFFDIPGTDPLIPVRLKDAYDNAEPSGNAVSILNLLRLSHIIGSDPYRSMASKSLGCFGSLVEEIPAAMPHLLIAADFSLSQPLQIIFAGNRRHPVIQEMIDEVHTRFLPEKIMVFADGADGQEFLKGFVPFFGTITSAAGKQTAYLCQNYTCDLPVSDVETMIHILENKNRKPRTEHSL